MPRVAVCLCDGCPDVGEGPARWRLAALPAGLMRVGVDCARAVEPVRVLELLLTDVDGVLILGCAEGGQLGAVSDFEVEERLKVMRSLIAQAGLAPDRLAARWLSQEEREHMDPLWEGLLPSFAAARPGRYSPCAMGG